MSDRRKMNLEELRKSFPSLDDFSAKKLLAGGPGPGQVLLGISEATLEPIWGEAPPGWDSGSNPSGGGPNTGEPSGGATASAAGSDYFGDYDWGNDSWGDGGIGDGGWGDDGPGGDSNPGGSEGGNPNGEQGPPQVTQGELPINNTGEGNRPYQVRNNWPITIYGKPENNVPADQRPNVVVIPPGGTTNIPIDGLSINGIVYKFINGYGWIDVNPNGITTNYNWYTWLIQTVIGGVEADPPEDDAYGPGQSGWQDLFDVP